MYIFYLKLVYLAARYASVLERKHIYQQSILHHNGNIFYIIIKFAKFGDVIVLQSEIMCIFYEPMVRNITHAGTRSSTQCGMG